MEFSGALAGLSGYEELADRVLAARREADDTHVTEYSPDGLITVVVNGRGELVELELDPRIYRDQNADALAETILATVRDACAAADRKVARVVMGLAPDGYAAEDDVDTKFDPALHVLGRYRGGR